MACRAKPVHYQRRTCQWRPNSQQMLLILTVLGAILGAAFGYIIRINDPSETTISLVMFPGEWFMRMLKMLIIPVIVTSIVTGLVNLDVKKSGKIGLHAIIYYVSTSLLATIWGTILVLVIHPGNPTQMQPVSNKNQELGLSFTDSFLDLLRNAMPENIVTACFEMAKTVTAGQAFNHSINVTEAMFTNISDAESGKSIRNVRGSNVLGLITFFAVFGAILSKLGDEGRAVASMFRTFNKIFMEMITLGIWFSPIGVCSLIAGNILRMDKSQEILKSIGMYMVTSIIAEIFHAALVMPLIFWVITRRNPYKLALAVSHALLTAFGVDSSAATIPVTTRCLENNTAIDKRLIQFLVPLGATMNMDATAIMQAVATITVAQMNNVTLTFAQLITLSLTATAASVGAAAVPDGGMVALVLVLTALGLPTTSIGVLWSIDWLLGRFRATVNVFGDCIGAGIIHHLNRMSLDDVTNDGERMASTSKGDGGKEAKSLVDENASDVS